MDRQQGQQEHVGEGQPQVESGTGPTENRHSEEYSPDEGVADTESRSAAADDASLVGEGREEGGSGAPAPAGDGGQTAEENEDGWFYLDDGGEERGPYSLQEMLTWWNCQLLRPDLPVRRGSETEYAALSARPEFNPYYAYYAHYYSSQSSASSSSVASEPTAETGTATTATATTTDYPSTGGPLGDHTPAGGYYAAAGTQPYGGAPQQSDADRELAARLMAESSYKQVGSFNARTGRFQVQKRGWDDPAGRQIAHYFDEQAWQQQAQQGKPKKIKLTKKEIQKFKEKKKKKKIPAYLLDD